MIPYTSTILLESVNKRRFNSSNKTENTNSMNVLFIVDTKNNLSQTKLETQKLFQCSTKLIKLIKTKRLAMLYYKEKKQHITMLETVLSKLL